MVKVILSLNKWRHNGQQAFAVAFYKTLGSLKLSAVFINQSEIHVLSVPVWPRCFTSPSMSMLKVVYHDNALKYWWKKIFRNLYKINMIITGYIRTIQKSISFCQKFAFRLKNQNYINAFSNWPRRPVDFTWIWFLNQRMSFFFCKKE